MPFIDFAELKRNVSIEQAAKLLNLSLKPSASQLRGSCPRVWYWGRTLLSYHPG